MDRFKYLLSLKHRSNDEELELLKLKQNMLKGKTLNRTVSLNNPKTVSDNSLEFTFISNDNGGVRYDWANNKYYVEVLDVTGANFENLRTFFKDHTHSVDSAVGKIDNIRVENNELVGRVTFGSDADSQTLLTKYKDGILTDVSVGYKILDYSVEDRSATNEQDMVTVTNFEIFEVSAVGLGFDSGAKKRNKDEKMDKELREKIAKLEAIKERSKEDAEELKRLKAKLADIEAKQRAAELEKLKKENAEMKRQAEIASIAAEFGDRGAKILKQYPDVTPDEFRSKILADFAGESKNKQTGSQDERGALIDAIVDGLAIRSGAKIQNPSAGYEKYKNAPLTSIANILLPEDKRSLNPVEVAERSLVSGDFPLLLQSVGARVLTSEFEAQTASYQTWIKMVDVPDFRVMQELTTTLGGGRLSKTLETGDLKELGGVEKAESWQIETFGNKFVLTRKMLINDDLGAFTNIVATFGRMAQTTANGIAYDILQLKGDYANYKMADGVSPYAASRKNTATDALSGDALSAGRVAMSKHKSIDGKTPLNIVPKYLIVPPELEVTAREILNATSKVGADNVNVPNVNKNLYTLVVDAEITSPTAWYLLADYRTIKMGFLAGTNRKPVIKKNESSVLRTVFEGVFDIGVMFEDYRGIYRGNV